MSGIGGTKSQDTGEDQQSTEDEKRHSPEANSLDPSAQAAINKEKVDDDAGEQTEDRERKSVGEEGAIGSNTNEGGKVRGVGSGLGAKVHLAREEFPGVAKTPRFNPQVVHVNDDRNDQAEDAEVGSEPILPERAKDTRAGVKSMLASHATHGPFGPSDRQTEKK